MGSKTIVSLAAGFCLVAGAVCSAQTTLYSNGPIVSHPGAGLGGADVSELPVGGNTIGENFNLNAGVRIADNFTVPAGQTWNVSEFVTFGYQTGSPTSPSTFTGLVVRIWNGDPSNAASQVVFGDITTNRLNTGATAWSNIYRTTTTTGQLNSQRPVMRIVGTLPNVSLTAGTYWVEWATQGSGASGPFIPPITTGSTMPMGNALIWRNLPWVPVVDTLYQGGNFPLDLPFEIRGTEGSPCYPDCNGDGLLNLSDFGCFTTQFALGMAYADCNGDGIRNLADFGCFTTKFALGCP